MWLYDRLASRGFKVFLDRKDAGVLHDLPALVARSKCFIFVLSSGIFGSRWCLLELAAAVQAEVRAVFIFWWSLSAKLQMTNFVQCFVVVVVGLSLFSYTQIDDSSCQLVSVCDRPCTALASVQYMLLLLNSYAGTPK